jgi:hypothetical protein
LYFDGRRIREARRMRRQARTLLACRVSRQLIVRLAVTLCVKVPSAPVNVRVFVPVEADEATVTVTVACPVPDPLIVTCVGETAQVTPEPPPLQESDTVPLN